MHTDLATIGILALAACAPPSSQEEAATSTGDISTATEPATGGLQTGGTSGAFESTDDSSPESTGREPHFDVGLMPDIGVDPDAPQDGIPGDCASAASVPSSVGCTFFGVDLNNAEVAEEQQYGIIVSNVQPQHASESVVEARQDDGTWIPVAGPQEIPPLSSFAFHLADSHIEGSGIGQANAYRVRATRPVVAYQFNPLDGQLSYSTDASLLYPVTSWDHTHHVLGYEVTLPEDEDDSYTSYVTIVAAMDGTEVEVTPPVVTLAGPGVPAGQPGVPFSVSLDAGDTAQVATEVLGTSMTGTRIASDAEHPVGVFTGTECTVTELGACDHMEEMMVGLRLWGERFVASRYPVRVVGQLDWVIWHIYASEDDTTITFQGHADATGLPKKSIILDAGESEQLWVSSYNEPAGDFYIESDKPIAVMEYMTGIGGGGGDPAMMMLSPTEQYLPRYVVLIPDTWLHDFLLITRPAGATVELDGVVISDKEFSPVGLGDFEVARLDTPDGVHTVDGLGEPVSVSVVGYDQYDSYAYLGGAGTAVINPSPRG